MESTLAPCIRLFVYGTLKRGSDNHHFLDGVEFAGTGVVYGRLHDLGVPALKPAPKTRIAEGTGDFVRDLALQTEAEGCPAPALGRGGWSHVRGEIYLVKKPQTLARIDGLEGFRPGGDCLYKRTLVAAETDVGVKPVWVYGMDTLGGRRLAAPTSGTEVHWPISNLEASLPSFRWEMHRVFAYGSLLFSQDARRTAPKALWRGRAFLPAHRLALTKYSGSRSGGVADVVPDCQHGVWGGLYEVGKCGLARLDQREGHPVVYRREPMRVWVDGHPDAPITAWVYRVVNPDASVVPASEEYKSLIVRGAHSRRLPKAYIRENIESLPVRAGTPYRTVCWPMSTEEDGDLLPGWEEYADASAL